MTIPKVNVDEVAVGNIGVMTATMASVSKFGEATVAYFLDLVPERGEKLWDRFRNFQKDNGGDGSFLDFVQSIFTADPIKLLYPKECTLDMGTRKMLAVLIQGAIATCGVRDDADILQIYFGEGEFYNAARQVSCKGCPEHKCRHNLGSRRR